MSQKRALITGVTGQDGAYLAQLLLGSGYVVVGTFRGTTPSNTWRLDELGISQKVILMSMDLLDAASVEAVIAESRPTEVYNLAAQSNVSQSFEDPVHTGEIDALGTARLLEGVRRLAPTARFCQASTSEMFGGTPGPLHEDTPFSPKNPYAAAKAYAHWLTASYRTNCGIHAGSAILFNHESPLRGENFVTRKITRGMARLSAGCDRPIQLGNVNSCRDWGYAGDYVKGMWLMLQQNEPRDYVFGTGETHSVMDFVEASASCVGFSLVWESVGGEISHAFDRRSGRKIIQIESLEMRRNDTDPMRADYQRAARCLNWQPTLAFNDLVVKMTKADLARLSPSDCGVSSVLGS